MGSVSFPPTFLPFSPILPSDAVYLSLIKEKSHLEHAAMLISSAAIGAKGELRRPIEN